MAKEFDPLTSARVIELFVSDLSARHNPTKTEIETAVRHAIRALSRTSDPPIPRSPLTADSNGQCSMQYSGRRNSHGPMDSVTVEADLG
jgi:hypothetical protein